MKPDAKPESFVARWSRRKLAVARETAPVREAPLPAGASASSPAAAAPVSPAVNTRAETAATAAPELPPIESLTFESDFTAFLRPGVDPGVKQAALHKLLRDPRFNAMDGLDVYIDDYTKPAPLDPRIAQRLADALFTPTRVNEQGYAENIPAAERVAAQTPPPDAPPPGAAQPVAHDAAAASPGQPAESAPEPAAPSARSDP